MRGWRTDAREKDMSDREIVALRERLASRVRSGDYRQRCRDINARGLQYGIARDSGRAAIRADRSTLRIAAKDPSGLVSWVQSRITGPIRVLAGYLDVGNCHRVAKHIATAPYCLDIVIAAGRLG